MERPPDSRLRGLPALILAQVSLHSGVTGLRLAGPLLLLQSGAPAWQVGAMFACFGLGPLAVAWPIGRHVDRRGYRPPMAIALGLALLAVLTGAVASFTDGLPRLALLCAAGAIGGAAANAGLITLQRTAARMARDAAALRGTFAWVGLAPSASNVSGPLAAGVLIDLAGARIALFALAAFPLLGWALARLARPPQAPAPGAAGPSGTLLDLLRNPTVRRMMLIDFLATGGWDAHAYFVPTLGHARGLSATTIGTIFGLFAAGTVAVRAAIPWVAHRLVEARVLTVSIASTALLFAIYPLGESAAYMGVLAFALGTTIGLAQPMVLSTMHQAVPEAQRGGVLALRTLWVNLHSVTLPLVLAAGVTAAGPTAMLLTVAAVVGAGTPATRSRR